MSLDAPSPAVSNRLLRQLGVWLLAASTLCWQPVAAQTGLPDEVIAALQAAELAPGDLVAVVQEAGSNLPPRLAWNALRPVNPASLMKLFPAVAALELLGPAWQWSTPVWLSGALPPPRAGAATGHVGSEGIYEGDVTIRGSGDPTLTIERVWLLLNRLQQLGIRDIRGDIVIDRTAFGQPAGGAGDFDDEPLRPYNVQPDALLLNQKVLFISFTPDPSQGIARIAIEPPLDGVEVPASVALSDQACADWRSGLQADFGNPTAPRFSGAFPVSCGSKTLAVGLSGPADLQRALAGRPVAGDGWRDQRARS